MLNHIDVCGRLVRDPELRRTNSGSAVTSFTIACDRDFGENKETDFIECVAFKHTAEFVSKYFTKGRMAVVSGRLQTRSWTDKEGNKRKSVEVVVENVYFGDSKKDDAQSNSRNDYQPNNRFVNSNETKPAANFAMLDDDDSQLPF